MLSIHIVSYGCESNIDKNNNGETICALHATESSMQWGIRDEALDRRFIDRGFIAERSHKSRVSTRGNSKIHISDLGNKV